MKLNNEFPFSVEKLIENDVYVVPIYQRNYAWGKAEITQLINDIYQSADSDKHEANYYIGSLVCFKRSDGSFELIDGQQRCTAIALINLYLRTLDKGAIGNVNLKFDARKETQRYFEIYAATKAQPANTAGIVNFTSATDFIKEALDKKDIDRFAKHFYNGTKIFRVEVPDDTDLNHYFEIMNSRGEQLEKHEILKAQLMDGVMHPEIFALIWDACADMTEYVYFNFDAEKRKIVFDGNGELNYSSYEELCNSLTAKSFKSGSARTLLSIINDNVLVEESSENNPLKEKYRSVIDFPNFLLQVLKLEHEATPLNDEKLLGVFGRNLVSSAKFIFDLLKYRAKFDKYIAKQDLSDNEEGKQNWGIWCLTFSDNTSSLVNTFKEADSKELILLQTMLYYSNSSSSYNEWLHLIFRNKLYEGELSDYINATYNIVISRFAQSGLEYPHVTAFDLYFIDFLLWKFYRQHVLNNIKELHDLGIETLRGRVKNRADAFNRFRFRQLSSKEHLLPQTRVTEESKDVLNDIGNLCLISVSQNSAGNNEHPTYKKSRFKDDNSSLKRLIMFETFNGEEWTKEQIEKHKKEISALIQYMLSEKNV